VNIGAVVDDSDVIPMGYPLRDVPASLEGMIDAIIVDGSEVIEDFVHHFVTATVWRGDLSYVKTSSASATIMEANFV